MLKEIISFGDTDVTKHKLYHRKSLILLEDVDLKKIQVSSMASSGKNSCKYCICYKDDDQKTKPLRRELPKRALM